MITLPMGIVNNYFMMDVSRSEGMQYAE